MILYFAGTPATGEEAFYASGVRNRLLSFAEMDGWGKDCFRYWMNTTPAPEGRLFLDSGAFGAHTRGVVLDIHRYCDYIKAKADVVHVYASLDVIGDWRGSARNYDIMRKAGLHPIPTFHMNSPNVELRRMLRETDYIALGGVVGATVTSMKPWLDVCWRTLRDFWPKKVHIFGVLAQWALERYPFYSADGSSVIVGGGMGRVQVFRQGRIFAMPWTQYARQNLDGRVMDGVATDRAKGGSAYCGRYSVNAQSQLALERHVTDVWSQKGVRWDV